MNKLKLALLASAGSFTLAFADGAAMAQKVEDAVTANSDALWAVGGTIIVLSAIALIISRIKRVTS